MIGIVFSTIEEAEPFLNKYERGRFSDLAEGEALHDDTYLVSVLGIGKIKATLRTDRLLSHYKLTALLHAGTCTSLVGELEIGTLVGAQQVFEGDRIELATPSYPRMPLGTPFPKIDNVTLVTQDHTVSGATELSYWQRIADITDMTGYAAAYVAAMHGVPCYILKIVSGHAGVDDKSLRKTLDASYSGLADYMVKNLGALSPE